MYIKQLIYVSSLLNDKHSLSVGITSQAIIQCRWIQQITV